MTDARGRTPQCLPFCLGGWHEESCPVVASSRVGAMETTEAREAVLGELVHDRRAEAESGWFIVGVEGYFDVDNACWCTPEEGDAPWTSEFFELHGPVTELLRGSLAERLRAVLRLISPEHITPIGKRQLERVLDETR